MVAADCLERLARGETVSGLIGLIRHAPTEIEAILAAPDRTTWLGRRHYSLLLLAAQTGLRLSDLIG